MLIVPVLNDSAVTAMSVMTAAILTGQNLHRSILSKSGEEIDLFAVRRKRNDCFLAL